MPSANQIKVATTEIAEKIKSNFKNTTWVADRLGDTLVTLGFSVTVKKVHEFLNPSKRPPRRSRGQGSGQWPDPLQ